MKRLAGTPNPRSWKETKVSTYPGGGVGSAPLGGTIHSGCGSPERGHSKPSATRASRSSTVTMEKGHGSCDGTTVTRSAIAKRRGWRRSGQGTWFSFSGYSLRLRKPKQEASSRVKNRNRSLFRVYKGPGKTRSTLRPNPPRSSNSKTKRPFLERLACATGATRIARPVALTPRRSRQHLWQVRRASLRLRHNDRVKKGAQPYLNSYPSPPPLSLLPQGPGKGTLWKGSFSAEEAGPDPHTDQGFEGWPLGKVSTAAPEHSDFKPITDQGFKGWPLGRVRQPPQSARAPCPLLIRGS
jgi:hypothetical protein